MIIVVNGKDVEVTDRVTLADFILDQGVDSDAVIVELNLVIVKKEVWEQTRLQQGDQIELLEFVGGG